MRFVDDFRDAFDFGGRFAVQLNFFAGLCLLHQFFEGGLIARPQRAGLMLKLLGAFDIEF